MAHYEGILKSSGIKVSPYFRPLFIGKLTDKYLSIRTQLNISFTHILLAWLV
jgi:hypothetical protein